MAMFLAVQTWEAEASLKKERRIKYVQRGADAGDTKMSESMFLAVLE